jgi:nitrate reductase cytochrome c-type subunit
MTNEEGTKMQKMICSLIILFLFAGVPVVGAADRDCPDCPKTALTSPLDPNWREFKPPPLAPGEVPDCHRVQFGKKKCMDCHKKDTPVAYKQWLGSKHGINNVKCGTCHGDVANYRAMPDRDVCIGCHSYQVKHMPKLSLVTNCSFCHKSHWFTVHNIAKYERFAPGRKMRFKVPGF